MYKGTRYRQTKALRIKSVIYDFIASSTGPITPQELANLLIPRGHVNSLQSIYSYLRELVADGEINRIEDGGRAARYEVKNGDSNSSV